MITFFAASSKLVKMGSLQQCLDYANELVSNGKASMVKIIKARAGEKDAQIIMEVNKDGQHRTPNGRWVNLKLLTKEAKSGEESNT